MTAAPDHRDEGVPPVALVPVPGPRVEARPWQMDDLWSKVQPTITCWIWHGPVDEDGYGKYSGRGAHVVVFERVIGKVPDGFQLDHLCRNRRCVNPAHLDVVTSAVNLSRIPSGRAGRSISPLPGSCRGAAAHPMTPENTDIRPGDGARQCRACRLAAQERQSRKRSLARAAARPGFRSTA